MRDGRLSRNPAQGVKLPKAATPAKRFLTHQQLQAVGAGESGRYRMAVLVLGYCGLRFGELAALRVQDIDLLRGRISVELAGGRSGQER